MYKPTPEDTAESLRRIRALELLKKAADLIEDGLKEQGLIPPTGSSPPEPQ